MVSEVSDDLVLDVAPALARRGTTCTGPACRRTTCPALRRHRGPTIMALTELGDQRRLPSWTSWERLDPIAGFAAAQCCWLSRPVESAPLCAGRKFTPL